MVVVAEPVLYSDDTKHEHRLIMIAVCITGMKAKQVAGFERDLGCIVLLVLSCECKLAISQDSGVDFKVLG